MLKLAEEMLGPLAAQLSLHEGYIVSAPDGPFERRPVSSPSTFWAQRSGSARCNKCAAE
jgi:hypothetical protein